MTPSPFFTLMGEVLDRLRTGNPGNHHTAILLRLEDAVAVGIPPGYFETLSSTDQVYLLDFFLGLCTRSGRSALPPPAPVVQLIAEAFKTPGVDVYAQLEAVPRAGSSSWLHGIARLSEHSATNVQERLCRMIVTWLFEHSWDSQIEDELTRWFGGLRADCIRTFLVQATKERFPLQDGNEANRLAWFVEHAYTQEDLPAVQELVNKLTRGVYLYGDLWTVPRDARGVCRRGLQGRTICRPVL